MSLRAKYFFLSLIIFLTGSNLSLADDATPFDIKIVGVSLKTIMERIVAFLLHTAGELALLALIIAGIYYVASNGNPDAQQKAKRMIIYIIEGLFVILLSYSLLAFIDKLLLR
jgi:hypothetical protein